MTQNDIFNTIVLSMKKISTVVKNILFSSEVAVTALEEGYLNFSQYAHSIQKEVEREAKKPVKIGSIVVALSRLSQEKKEEGFKSLRPEVRIDSLNAQSGIIEISFTKRKENLDRLKKFYQKTQFELNDFFLITQSLDEIMILALEREKKKILKIFEPEIPIVLLPGLASLTVQFSDKYLLTPNIFYSILSELAMKRVNLIEIVSTFPGMSFILFQKDLEQGFTILNGMLQRNLT